MKEALKVKSDAIQEKITLLRKELRKAERSDKRSEVYRLNDEIDWLLKRKKLYSSTVMPVIFSNGLVINGTLLRQFVKKIRSKGVLEAKLPSSDTFELHYQTGKLTLLDQSKIYSDMELPEGEALLEELGVILASQKRPTNNSIRG